MLFIYDSPFIFAHVIDGIVGPDCNFCKDHARGGAGLPGVGGTRGGLRPAGIGGAARARLRVEKCHIVQDG